MIAGWLANKLAAPILLGLCVLLIVGLAIQTVRINGISVFGWYAVDGYKPLYETIYKKYAVAQNNEQALQGGLDKCNASIEGYKKASLDATAKAQAAADKAAAAGKEAAMEAAKILALKPQGEVCKAASKMILERLGK